MNIYRRAFYCSLLLVLLCHAAVGQYSTGSLVVLSLTPDRATVAADSCGKRRCPPDGKPIVSDDVCKVLTFDNKYIFAYVGFVAAYPTNAGCKSGKSSFSTKYFTEALYREGNISSVADFVNKWSDKMSAEFSELAKHSSSMPVGRDGNLLGGIFVGKSGYKIVARGVIFQWKQGRLSVKQTEFIPDGTESAFGDTDVFNEFKANQTTRAKQWHQRIDTLNSEQRVVALATLGVDFDTTGEISRPVDSVRITPFGTEWISVKPKCREQERSNASR